MSAIEDPEYPERPFIRMFLSGFDNGAWKDASLNWIEETQENAVEVIATSSTGKTVALEHTLIELFTGEKYDSTIFVEAFETRIEKNPDLIIPGRALDVKIPVGALVGVKDRDDAGERLLTWMKSNHANIPVGDSQATVVLGNGVNLTVKFRNAPTDNDTGYCWLGRCDKPNTFDKVVERAVKRKVPKLVRTQADVHILLLQREHISMSDTELRNELEKLTISYTDIAKVEEIWYANTSIFETEGWCYFLRIGDCPTETMRFQNGVLKHRRDDRYGINEDVN
jgi:hypothetical protein